MSNLIKSLYFNQFVELFLGLGLVVSVGLLFGAKELGIWATITMQLLLLDMPVVYGTEKIYKKHGIAPLFLEGWTNQVIMYVFSGVICLFYFLFAPGLQTELFAKMPDNSLIVILGIFFLRTNRSIYSKLAFLMGQLKRITIFNCVRLVVLTVIILCAGLFPFNFDRFMYLMLLNELMLCVASYILFKLRSFEFDSNFLRRSSHDIGYNLGTGFSSQGSITLINLAVANLIPINVLPYFYYSQRLYSVINLLVKPFLRIFQIQTVSTSDEAARFLEKQVFPLTIAAIVLIIISYAGIVNASELYYEPICFFALGLVIFYNPYVKGLYLSVFVNQNKYKNVFAFEFTELIGTLTILYAVGGEDLIFLMYFFVIGSALMAVRCCNLFSSTTGWKLILNNVGFLVCGIFVFVVI